MVFDINNLLKQPSQSSLIKSRTTWIGSGYHYHYYATYLKFMIVSTILFEYHFYERTQSVRKNNIITSTLPVMTDVPQGSILGSILSNTFVNDMSDDINDCMLVIHADDTHFLHSNTTNTIDNLIQKNQETLHRATMYFLKNRLLMNDQKTQCMFISTYQVLSMVLNNITVQLHETILQPTTYVINLGLHTDRYITFNKHISDNSKKVNGILMYVNRIKDYFNNENHAVIIQLLVLNILNYCNVIWSTTNITILKDVQKLQNFAAKVVDGKSKRYDHVTPILKELKWLNVKDQAIHDTGITMFKYLTNSYPEHLVTFPIVMDIISSTTRQFDRLYIPKTNTHLRDRSLSVRDPKLWNSLPS